MRAPLTPLKTTFVAAALALGLGLGVLMPAYAEGDLAPKWVNALPIPPVAQPVSTAGGIPLYEMTMSESQQDLGLKDQNGGPILTTVYGYNDMYLGPTIEASTGAPIQVRWINHLPAVHLFTASIDHTLSAAEGVPDSAAVVHWHGGHVPVDSDGYPDWWFTSDPAAPPNGKGGPAGNSVIYTYPNNQASATLWYHDHASGILRLNVYAGLAGFYFLRDKVEAALRLPKGPYEIPLVLQDKTFNADGSLYYPTEGDAPGVHPQWVPEFFGDTPVINGKVYPYLEVEPRRYRFRIVNGSNARFYNLSLSNGQSLIQIGTDGGLLKKPVSVGQLLLAPGERADVVVNFKKMAGQTILLQNNAPAPYPEGDPSEAPLSELLQIRVTKPMVGKDKSSVPKILNPAAGNSATRALVRSAVQTRDIYLEEHHDDNDNPVEVLINGQHFMEAPTENPKVNTTEIWRFANTTSDTHPMHLHLLEFKVLDRTPFDRERYLADLAKGTPQPLESYFTGPAEPPEPNELGWKDTWRCSPGYVNRLVGKFADYTGTYVYHCHILEHEDNDMMRPLSVVP